MSKLLNKPLKAFTIYALVILVLSIPAYLTVVDHIWLDELDEQNEIMMHNIKRGLQQYEVDDAHLDGILALWCKIQPWTKITPLADGAAVPKDSVYSVMRPNKLDDDDLEDRFRGLSSHIEVKGRKYGVVIETNVEEADETMLSIAMVTFFFFVLLVAGFIFLNRRIARASWRPFRHTLEKLKLFDLATGKPLPLEQTDIQEFQELNEVLQRLIERNISVYNQQKVFIENASHELQTPLAILKSKLELLLQNKDMTGEQAEILNALEPPMARVTRINKNLLLLAKIENSQFPELEPLDLSLVLEGSKTLFADYIEDKALRLEIQCQGTVHVTCNKFLLETLVYNLLTNAIRHSAPGSMVQIELTPTALVFKNAGMQPLDRGKLFERFSVASTESTNSGLGLAIVKEICQRYGWGITYAYEGGFHSFALRF